MFSSGAYDNFRSYLPADREMFVEEHRLRGLLYQPRYLRPGSFLKMLFVDRVAGIAQEDKHNNLTISDASKYAIVRFLSPPTDASRRDHSFVTFYQKF